MNNKKDFVGIGGVLLGLLAFFITINWASPVLLWDENVYLGNARSHVAESNFTEDFRFPLLEYIIASVWLFTGESVFIARFIVVVFGIASVLLLYLIGREYFQRRFSIFLSILFAFSPLVLFWGFRAYGDVPAMFFATLSFYLLLKPNAYGLAGIASALAFLSRFSLGLFPLSVAIYLIINKKPRQLMLFAIFFFVALTPWLLYNQANYGNPIWDLQEQYSVIAKWTSPEPIMKQIKNLFIFTNVLIPLLLGFGIWAIRKNKGLNYLVLIYVAISFICYLFFVNLKDERYYLSFLPFIYLVSFQGLLWFKSQDKKLFVYLSIALVISSIFSATAIIEDLAYRGHCEKKGSITQAVEYLDDKVSVNDTLLGNAWPWFGYCLNAKVACLWDENITMLIDLYNPKYVAYNDRIGTGYKGILDNCEELRLDREFTGACGEKTYLYKVT